MLGIFPPAPHWPACKRSTSSHCVLRMALLVALAGALPARANGPAAVVKDINPGPQGSYYVASTDPLMNWTIGIGEKLFFLADDGVHGVEPWVSSGTTSTTNQIKELNSVYWYPWYFVNWNGILFFTVRNDTTSELWKSDGTSDGTVLVKALGGPSAPDIFSLTHLTLAGDTLYFFTSGSGGQTLWKSDGTTAGTLPITTFSAVQSLVSAQDRLFFLAPDTNGGSALWTSDGTPAGTRILKTIAPGGNASDALGLTNVDGTLFFILRSGCGPKVWTSDGTAAGTVQIKDLGYNCLRGHTPYNFIAVGSRFFFIAGLLMTGKQLWVSDGTAQGTLPLMSIDFEDDTGAGSLASVGGKLIFTHDDPLLGHELWVSDGTVSGTKLVKDINPGVADSQISGIRQVRSDGWALFAASNGADGVELWQTDGTPERTLLLQDIAPGAASSRPTAFTAAGGRVYFAADDGFIGMELWSLEQGIFPDLWQHKRYLPLIDTTYAVGVWGRRSRPRKLLFWPLSATNVADSGQKEMILEGSRPPNLPLKTRPRNSYY